ncbi:hypothetical protein ACH5RR_013422 [Cinchona calisaya]|uniref:Uncharacterized protein n=1 Tax=Cinchona calisaya TaxID=153742 RepID=A0ABD2ZZZ5_9GENT
MAVLFDLYNSANANSIVADGNLVATKVKHQRSVNSKLAAVEDGATAATIGARGVEVATATLDHGGYCAAVHNQFTSVDTNYEGTLAALDASNVTSILAFRHSSITAPPTSIADSSIVEASKIIIALPSKVKS